MTNRELGIQLGKKSQEERQITAEVLNLIHLGLERRAYLEHGFSSMFDWLTRGFKYSNAAAYRRIEAARLLKAVPSAAEKFKSGKVNLSTLSQAQTAIKTQEKITGKKVSAEMKCKIVSRIESKSTQEAGRILFGLLPEGSTVELREKRTALNAETVRHSMNFNLEMSEDLRRAKEVLSHIFPKPSDAEVIGYALKFLLAKKDPSRKPASGAEAARVIPSCTFKDPLTGQICGSRHQVQVDHIRPKALGGGDEPENLRYLCRPHNFFEAERAYGRNHMDRFRKCRKKL